MSPTHDPSIRRPSFEFLEPRLLLTGGVVGSDYVFEFSLDIGSDHELSNPNAPEKLDFGDAPDSTLIPGYPTLLINNGARHVIGGPYLGNVAPDAEADGQPVPPGLGDDLNPPQGISDEDGVNIPALAQGVPTPVSFLVFAPANGAVVESWIDFNGDRDWTDPGEWVVNSAFPNGNNVVWVTAPVGSIVGTTYARFRISMAGTGAPTGLAADGEVEDYAVKIEPALVQWDFGDAPDSTLIPGYPTLLINNGARHVIGGPWLGDATDNPDAEPDGQPQANALGDDLDSTKPIPNDDEDGVQIPVLVQGQLAQMRIEVNNPAGLSAWVDAWIDFNGSLTWDPWEAIWSGWMPVGINVVGVTVPAGSIVGQTFARVRINSQGALGPTGPASDGEVEDYKVFIEAPLQPKWEQPPVPADPGNLFNGWNEPSIYGSQWQIAADDWVCSDTSLVTGLTWWGSYLGWEDPIQSPDAPDFYHFAIWTDVPAGDDEPFSHPGQVVWKYVASDVTAEFAGWDYDPRTQSWESAFRYHVDLPSEARFQQSLGFSVLWLSIAAGYETGQTYEHPWGWKTRPRDPESPAPDAAVRVFNPTIPFIGSKYSSGEPLRWPEPSQSWDLAFEIVGQPMGEEQLKWSQPPAPYSGPVFNGWDEYSVYGSRQIVADDWLCTTDDPIQAIQWWGSFLGWNKTSLPPDMPQAFHIGIWTDMPANPQDPEPFSHPGTLIWDHICDSFSTDWAGWDVDPRAGGLVAPEAKFGFYQELPEEDWFYQEPGEHIYWISISAMYGDIQVRYPFGWETRPRDPASPAPDDAVVITNPTAPQPDPKEIVLTEKKPTFPIRQSGYSSQNGTGYGPLGVELLGMDLVSRQPRHVAELPEPGQSVTISSFFDIFVDVSMGDTGEADSFFDVFVSMAVTNVSPDVIDPAQVYTVELLSMSHGGGGGIGGMLGGILMIRESPTRVSSGGMTVTALGVVGGYAVDSFFDIFTEVSTDGGENWTPADQPVRMKIGMAGELFADPQPFPIQGTEYSSRNGTGFGSLDMEMEKIELVSREPVFVAPLPPPGGNAAVSSFFDIFTEVTVGGTTYVDSFFDIYIEVSIDNVTGAGDAVGTYETEILSMSMVGGGPGGVMIRESPTRASRGGLYVHASDGVDHDCDSFFDIYIEVSTDGGGTWTPADQAIRAGLDLRVEPQSDPQLFPLQGTKYASRNGTGFGSLDMEIEKIEMVSREPSVVVALPPPAGSNMVSSFFDIYIEVSTDGGGTYHCDSFFDIFVEVDVGNVTAPGDAVGMYETEITSLNLSGGDLPAGVMIRESPTRASSGSHRVTSLGGGGGGAAIDSFFDIYIEVSTDGGGTWTPADQAIRLDMGLGGEQFPGPQPFPIQGTEYASWSGTGFGSLDMEMKKIELLSREPINVIPLPPPGGSTMVSSFFDIFTEVTVGGTTYADSFFDIFTDVNVRNVTESGDPVETYETEILSLNLSGADLPAGIQIRESPTRASSGQHRVTHLTGGGYMVSSFFDIFLEVSTDGGQTWTPADRPMHSEMGLGVELSPEPQPFPVQGTEYASQNGTGFGSLDMEMEKIELISKEPVFVAPLPPPGGSTMVSSFFDIFGEVTIGGTAHADSFFDIFVDVNVRNVTAAGDPVETYETEILSLNLSGGGLPGNVMIRESPTRASSGQHRVTHLTGGGAAISSFFDIFLEVSTDGGRTWTPADRPLHSTFGLDASGFRLGGPIYWPTPADSWDMSFALLTTDTTAPQVTNVAVSGTGWTIAPYNVPVGSIAQFDTLPWGNIDQVSVVFSEDVNVALNDFAVIDRNGVGYFAAGVVYDPATFTATWTLANPLSLQTMTLAVADTVTDIANNRLDGEWTDTVSVYPSGDGAAGGAFLFGVNVLPGDADQSGAVDAGDYISLKRNFGRPSGATFAEGNFDGDVDVDWYDLQIIMANFSNVVPPPPAPPAIPMGGGAGSNAVAKTTVTAAPEPTLTVAPEPTVTPAPESTGTPETFLSSAVPVGTSSVAMYDLDEAMAATALQAADPLRAFVPDRPRDVSAQPVSVATPHRETAARWSQFDALLGRSRLLRVAQEPACTAPTRQDILVSSTDELPADIETDLLDILSLSKLLRLGVEGL